ATGLQTGLAGPDDDRAVGKRAAKAGRQRLLEAVAVREQHDDGDNPPRDAEHRERRAEAVVIHAVERLDEELDDRLHGHISKRSASTGGSSAALRAGYVDVTTPIATSVASDTRPDGHDRIIPENRSGSGSMLTRRHRPSAKSMPAQPLASVRNIPSRKNCRWIACVV